MDCFFWFDTITIHLLYCFVCFDFNVPVSNFSAMSAMSGRVFLGWTSTKQWIKNKLLKMHVIVMFWSYARGKCTNMMHVQNFVHFTCSTPFTLCILEPPKWVLLQAVKTYMKCHITWHFIRVYSVCSAKTIVRQIMQYLKKYITNTPRYIQWTIPILFYQTRRKNLLVY